MVADCLQFRRRSAQTGHRCDVDDLARTLSGHGFAHRLTKKKCSGQVGGEHLVPLLQRHFLHRRSPRNAGVVDKNVDSAKLRERLLYDLLNRCLVFDIASQRQRLHTAAAQRIRRFLAALLLARAEDQIRPHLSQALGHLQTQPHRAARNNGDATG